MPDCFPRTATVPNQSPLFWVTHKDRYLRQLLIRDIQEETGRDLIVYFTDTDRSTAQIDPGDDVFFFELLSARKRDGVDLLLETPGGFTDPTEKICSLLRSMAPDLRVCIPRRAKSNGTVIALCGSEIMMSAASELGPIDPSVSNIPCEFILKAPPGSFNPVMVQLAQTSASQTRKLANNLLSTGMMKTDPTKISDTIDKLASRDYYHSHGSVVDIAEAKALGLTIKEFASDDPLWQKLWLLRTMYAFDCGRNGYAKIFEGEHISSSVTVQPQVSSPGATT